MVRPPQSISSAIACCQAPWFPQWRLLQHTPFISQCVLCSSPQSIILSLPSSSQPFHLFLSHLCHTRSALACFFFPFFISLSSLTLPLHWVIDLSGSHLALCWSPSLQTPSAFPLPLTQPFFFSSAFFISAPGLLRNITKASSLSFLFQSLAALSLSPSLSALQIIQLGPLPGYTKPLPARWHS